MTNLAELMNALTIVHNLGVYALAAPFVIGGLFAWAASR